MPFVDESKVTEWTNRLKSYFALLTHNHAASDITSGTLAVSQGGTGGTTALDARKNLSVPVDSSIAYVESTTATKNHAVGDYFMLGSVLMKATAAIATGEQITTSKATPVTVQSQIDTLRDSVYTPKPSINSGDLNDYREQGVYPVGSSIANLPSGGAWGILLVLRGTSTQGVTQMIVGQTTSGIFTRRWHYESGWTGWYKASVSSV